MFVTAREVNMLESVAEYFRRIEMPGPFIERAEAVCNTFREIISEPITAALVTDAYEHHKGSGAIKICG
jgi:hypothetical protein